MDAVINAGAPLLLIAASLAYAKRVQTLARRGKPVSVWRQLSFAVGVLLLLGSDLPPLAPVAEEIVVAHMVQHLLIGDLAGLFIALGITGPILQPMLARRPFSWLRALGNPLVALPIWALNLYVWHLSVLYKSVVAGPEIAPTRCRRRASPLACTDEPGVLGGDACSPGDEELADRVLRN